MSYQVLARKWRPHDFSSLLGQDHVVRALTHALTENRLHHAYLFTGTRGVGKTTISRILAKCLNCVGPDGKGGITAEPCGVCEACRAIDEDRFVDYIEMDAASTRGIDDMVSLLERAKYVPTNARFKVYMIDEVHQLTSAAFNAMLKTLEEPPEYVKFILATTDPQKVPVTVLSRCLQFNLKSLSPQLISSHMAELLDKEQISFEKPALRMLASGARGSMRDGLSLLDQAIAYSAGNVTLESVREMLGTIDSTTLIRLLGALANHEPKEIMKVENMLRLGQDKVISLSDCTITEAREYINTLMEYSLKEGLILTESGLKRTDAYLIQCIRYKRCCICGKTAEIHHVDAIGMGNDRRHVDDSEKKIAALCRIHHSLAHQKGWVQFADAYKVYGIEKYRTAAGGDIGE